MKNSDWIKVTDRLPEDNVYVLVLFKDYDSLEAVVCKIVRDPLNEVIWRDRHYCFYDICWSSHWMPIELPKEDNDD